MSFRSTTKRLIPSRLFRKIEPTGHLVEALLENIAYGFPMKGLKVIGVTGTAGKTTTCTLLASMLKDAGYKVAMMTTVSIDLGDGLGPKHNTTRMTSLGSLQLIKTVKKIKQNKVDWLILETTSQALSQHRVLGVPFSIVGFTNLGSDNFHYHGSLENYQQAKLKLFKQANRYAKGKRVGVVNADDSSAPLFIKAIKHPLTYGLDRGDIKAQDIKLTGKGSSFKVTSADQNYEIKTNLPGKFNIYNCLAAIGLAKSVGLTKEQIEKGIASFISIEGRMNLIDEGQDFTVIIDYAVTPESYRLLFDSVKPLAKGKIIVVFGSAGRRDELKRPIQGEIAGKEADIIILTEEDDRDLDGNMILNEIAVGAEKSGKVRDKDLFLIHDRPQAVSKAISLARTGDLVLLLGKGEETVIITNKPGFKPSKGHVYNEATDTITIPYNETETAVKALRKLKKS